jgi:2-keto-4-pentenoate hydratase/2-oxohepta-3-ene-1,7-dioic acid hydratase in catechol pathway
MKFIMMYVRGNLVAHLGVLLNDGSAVNITAAIPKPEFANLMALIESGINWRNAVQAVKDKAEFRIAPDQYRLAAPLPRPTQFRDSMCFFQHIEQCATARRPPNAEPYQLPEIYRKQPVYYIGNRMSVAGPEQDIQWPRYSKVMDFELELACVIGKQATNLTPENALDHVFGFTIFNDFSARDAQGREMEGRLGPAKGKHFDGGNVFGPCVVTADEIGDPQKLRMQARVNGETWCDNSSSTMNWTFGQLLAHISADETLYPGEVIASGTVGDGDTVELEIEKIGVLRNRVVTQK